MNNLSDYHFTKHFRAEDGENGSTNNKYGRYGQDIVIKVPKGTIIKDAQTGKVVADMFFDDDKKVLLKGGKGGRGNAKFATSVRQAPAFSEMGEKAVEKRSYIRTKNNCRYWTYWLS